MNLAPDRPADYPERWVTQFTYSDNNGPPGLSRPLWWDTREEAHAAARHARRDHNGGGVRVQEAYAYPPVGSDEQPLVVIF